MCACECIQVWICVYIYILSIIIFVLQETKRSKRKTRKERSRLVGDLFPFPGKKNSTKQGEIGPQLISAAIPGIGFSLV